MTDTIWKFPLTSPESTIMVPGDAAVLAVQMQHDRICVWMRLDPDAARSPRRFAVYGTDHPLPPVPGTYIGTVQQAGGDLVWHVYEAP